MEESLGVRVEDVVIDPTEDEACLVLLSNPTGFTRHLEAGEYLGGAVPATVVDPPECDFANNFTVTTHVDGPTDELLQEPDLPAREKQTLWEFLAGYHHVFSLEDGERGETDLVWIQINTGDASPKKQPTR